MLCLDPASKAEVNLGRDESVLNGSIVLSSSSLYLQDFCGVNNIIILYHAYFDSVLRSFKSLYLFMKPFVSFLVVHLRHNFQT